MPTQTASAITSAINGVSVPLLLNWWQQRKRIANTQNHLSRTLPKGGDSYLNAYYRLMEIYSVVKSGGVQAQKEAVQAFAKRELALLQRRLAEIDTNPTLLDADKQRERAKIEQEIAELHSANNWRLQALTDINPTEEAIVKQHISEIERILMQSKCA